MERVTYGVYREDARSKEGLRVVPAFVQVSARLVAWPPFCTISFVLVFSNEARVNEAYEVEKLPYCASFLKPALVSFFCKLVFLVVFAFL